MTGPYNDFRPEEHFVIPDPVAPREHSLPETLDSSIPAVIHKRQPHLGYGFSLLGILVLALLGVAVLLGVVGAAMHMNLAATSKDLPKASILIEAVTFGVTYAIAWLIFPRMWGRPFAEVIVWNAAAARREAGRLILIGFGFSIIAQLLESLLTLPKEMPVDHFFRHPSDVWIIAIFGTLIAPVCEEVFFRGFLLRGFAIFFDWIMLPKTEEAREGWAATDGLTPRAMIMSGVITSGLFAAMHAAQLGWAWNAVGVLWVVGGALTWVRIRYNSVAASSMVHAAYNGFLFLVMFAITGGFRHLDKLSNH